MELHEERALQKCAEKIRKDLDPTYSFLYDLFTKEAITHDDIELILGQTTRESKVTKLLTTLPRRGPNVFSTFKSLLQKNYQWLAKALDTELKNQTKKKSDDKNLAGLVRVVNCKLVPLVFSQPFDYAEVNEPLQKTVYKVEYLAKKLESNVHASLELSIPPKKNLSIDKLIEEKLKVERSDESAETRKLKEKIQQLEEKNRKETETLKSEINALRQTNRKQQRQNQLTAKENRVLKAKTVKLAKDVEKLTADNKNLKQAMSSMKTQNSIQELFPSGQ